MRNKVNRLELFTGRAQASLRRVKTPLRKSPPLLCSASGALDGFRPSSSANMAASSASGRDHRAFRGHPALYFIIFGS
jgi:hypothetical protein